jgi:hypothetical protein
MNNYKRMSETIRKPNVSSKMIYILKSYRDAKIRILKEVGISIKNTLILPKAVELKKVKSYSSLFEELEPPFFDIDNQMDQFTAAMEKAKKEHEKAFELGFSFKEFCKLMRKKGIACMSLIRYIYLNLWAYILLPIVKFLYYYCEEQIDNVCFVFKLLKAILSSQLFWSILYPSVAALGIVLLYYKAHHEIPAISINNSDDVYASLETIFRSLSPQNDLRVRNMILQYVEVMSNWETHLAEMAEVYRVDPYAVITKSGEVKPNATKNRLLEAIHVWQLQDKTLRWVILNTVLNAKCLFRGIIWDISGSLDDSFIEHYLRSQLPTYLISVAINKWAVPSIKYIADVYNASGVKTFRQEGELDTMVQNLPTVKEFFKGSRCFLATLKLASLGYKLRGKSMKEIGQIISELLALPRHNEIEAAGGIEHAFDAPDLL